MDLSSPKAPYFIGAAVVLITYFVLNNFLHRRTLLPYPPGPPPSPIIGNLLDIPTENAWITYKKLTEQYGSMVYLEALGNKLLILGNEETVIDLMDRRINFANGASTPMFTDLMGFGWAFARFPYGDKWRKHRRFLHAHVNSGVVSNYQDAQLESARTFVDDLLAAEHDNDVLPGMVRAYFGRTIVKMTYGIDVQSGEDEYISVPEQVLSAVNEASVPGRFLVDLFPMLKYIPDWFPGAGFKQFAANTRRLHEQMREAPFKRTREEMASGIAQVSIVQRMLEDADKDDDETLEMIKDVAGLTYLAGADTTVAAVTSFFLAMVIYPEVQRRAQAELNAVVGRDRLPEFSDQERLPYVKAVMSECLRWLPVLPVGVPHSTAEDDTYRGCFIPKGTIVFPLQWALLHDTVTYPDPEEFVPERYLHRLPSGAWTERSDVRNPRDFSFGFGRRACPGTHIAEQSLFASVATALHTLDIQRRQDPQGNEIVPKPNVSGGLLSHPKPFDYVIKMRDDATELVQMCRRS